MATLPDKITHLSNEAGDEATKLVEHYGSQIVIENDRLFAPSWDEAYVDLSAVIEPAVYGRLKATPIWMYSEDLPRAYAVLAKPDPIILVSEGLIGLISFCSLQSLAMAKMSFQQADPSAIRALEMQFLRIVATNCEHGWPILEHIEVKALDDYKQLITQRDCMLSFVLLHELGHIELKHLDGGLVHAADFEPRVADIKSKLHARELAADDYAFRALSADALRLATTLLSAWTYFEASLRVTDGELAHLSASHPLAVNRLHRLAQFLGESIGPHKTEDIAQAVDWAAKVVETPTLMDLEALEVANPHDQYRAWIDQYRATIAPLF